MLSLKRYGDLASNYLKKRKTKPQKKLRDTLFLQPLGIILFAFILLFFIFNLSVSLFIRQETFKAVETKSKELQNLYHQQVKSQQTPDQGLFQTSYMIIDQDEAIQYSSVPVHDSNQRFDAENLLEFFFDKEHQKNHYQNNGIAKIHLKDNDYSIKLVTARGILKDYYVTKGDSPSEERNYAILIFVNTTPMQQFLTLINVILGIIMLLTFALTGLLMYLTSRKLDQSFNALQNYVLAAGNRQGQSEPLILPYDEFNQVATSVDNMTEMISRNQKSQELFFQNSSHELRTPLMSIQSYAEAIHNGLVDSTAGSKVILDESKRMTHLVDDILTISRMESIPDKLHYEIFSLSDFLYDVSWRIKNKAELAGIRIEHQLSEKDTLISADEELLERAILNILTNAVRYAKSKICIATTVKEKNVEITISNDGPEIKSDEKNHLFDRFYKGSDGNHGIGLAMTKEIVTYHGGQIDVSPNQKNTSFIITLPLIDN